MKLRLATLLVLLLPFAASAAPRLQRGALADGTALVTVDQPSDVASLRWIVRSGALDDPLGKPGLARVVGQAVLEGGYGEDGAALRRDVERAGGRLEVRTGPDATVFRLDAPTGRFMELARRLVRIVTSPALPQAPVARVQRLVETSAGPGPRPLAERLGPILFPPTVAADGLAASHRDLVAFFEAHYVPANITVVVVGDIDREDVVAALEEADRLAPSADEPPMTLPSPSERPLHAQARAPLTRTVVGYEVGPVSARLCRGLAGLLELRLRQAWMLEAPKVQEVRGWCLRMNGAQGPGGPAGLR